MSRRLHGDAGQVAGIESVPFGLLVLVVGILVVAHTWAVVDAKFAAATAAREAARAYVEADGAAQALDDARKAGADAAAWAGRPSATVELRRTASEFGRCQRSRFVARLRIPAVGLPWLPGRPSVVVRAAHEEVVDPFRDDLAGAADCGIGS